MPAPLFQVEITLHESPVTDRLVAEQLLLDLGVEYDAIELDGAGGEADGIYLVGLLGKHRRLADLGNELFVGGNGAVVHVPQP